MTITSSQIIKVLAGQGLCQHSSQFGKSRDFWDCVWFIKFLSTSSSENLRFILGISEISAPDHIIFFFWYLVVLSSLLRSRILWLYRSLVVITLSTEKQLVSIVKDCSCFVAALIWSTSLSNSIAKHCSPSEHLLVSPLVSKDLGFCIYPSAGSSYGRPSIFLKCSLQQKESEYLISLALIAS